MSLPLTIPYEPLFDLWRLWLAPSVWPSLDKWLKQELSNRGGASVSAAQRALNREMGKWMFSAMRFVQLAGALEASYRAEAELDWAEWDSQWNQASAKQIPPAAFWYWVALREGAAQTSPKALRDAAQRKAWFDKLAQRLPFTPEGKLLWAGLRPAWLPLLQARQQQSGWSEQQLNEFLQLQNSPPPLWLRVQKNMPASEVLQSLKQDGVDVAQSEQGTLQEQALVARGGKYISATEAHKSGWIEVQDLASQQIAQTVAVKAGQKVWDACAGAGGKSLAIAARMNNKGVLVATDLHEYKLDELKRRSKRAELHNVRSFVWTGDAPLRLPKEVAQQQGFDWVLIDAPCSSSGTWRRNPDARWRFTPSDTQELIALQQQLLHNAAAGVRRGGHLVYATCSWQLSENEAQVQWFLENHPEFELQSQSMLGAPVEDADAMFAAVLRRKDIS